ncbi:hypothetical protein SUGI_0011560 [Cryptomeria japonica]|nr:hypothetical protein SUGI_0011560 [Cryptomeria japonica]
MAKVTNLKKILIAEKKRGRRRERKLRREHMEEKADILELLEIDYCRLISESNECTGDVMKALGPEGPGLLAITGVPNAQSLTNTLLSFARKLALMDDTQRRHILKIPHVTPSLSSECVRRRDSFNVTPTSAQGLIGHPSD